MIKEIAKAGPANWEAAEPVMTNMPAPIMAPMPIAMMFQGPSKRLSPVLSEDSASLSISETDLVIKYLFIKLSSHGRGGVAIKRQALFGVKNLNYPFAPFSF